MDIFPGDIVGIKNCLFVYLFVCLFVYLLVCLFVFHLNHLRIPPERLPESFVKIGLDLAEILLI